MSRSSLLDFLAVRLHFGFGHAEPLPKFYCSVGSARTPLRITSLLVFCGVSAGAAPELRHSLTAWLTATMPAVSAALPQDQHWIRKRREEAASRSGRYLKRLTETECPQSGHLNVSVCTYRTYMSACSVEQVGANTIRFQRGCKALQPVRGQVGRILANQRRTHNPSSNNPIALSAERNKILTVRRP